MLGVAAGDKIRERRGSLGAAGLRGITEWQMGGSRGRGDPLL